MHGAKWNIESDGTPYPKLGFGVGFGDGGPDSAFVATCPNNIGEPERGGTEFTFMV